MSFQSKAKLIKIFAVYHVINIAKLELGQNYKLPLVIFQLIHCSYGLIIVHLIICWPEFVLLSLYVLFVCNGWAICRSNKIIVRIVEEHSFVHQILWIAKMYKKWHIKNILSNKTMILMAFFKSSPADFLLSMQLYVDTFLCVIFPCQGVRRKGRKLFPLTFPLWFPGVEYNASGSCKQTINWISRRARVLLNLPPRKCIFLFIHFLVSKLHVVFRKAFQIIAYIILLTSDHLKLNHSKYKLTKIIVVYCGLVVL